MVQWWPKIKDPFFISSALLSDEQINEKGEEREKQVETEKITKIKALLIEIILKSVGTTFVFRFAIGKMD